MFILVSCWLLMTLDVGVGSWRNSWVVCKIKSAAPWNSHPQGCNGMRFLCRPLVFCVWFLRAAEHPPSLLCGATLSLQPNPSGLLHYYEFSLRLVTLSLTFPCCFSFLSLPFSTLRGHPSHPEALSRQSHPEVSSEPSLRLFYYLHSGSSSVRLLFLKTFPLASSPSFLPRFT